LPEWAWAYDYPHNVLNEGIMIEGCTWLHCRKLAQPVYPTPLYETMAAFLIAGILWMLRKRIKVPGVLFFIYVIFTGIERFFIEKIRVNPDIKIAGIEATQAEYISVILLIIGIVGVIWCIGSKPKTTSQ
jgi:prolipoprotein diacylglyceryltransferase